MPHLFGVQTYMTPNYRKIQYTQNEALRIATGCHKMSSIDHLHTEAEMLKVREHSELLSAQYLARCLEPGNVCHPITTRAIPERQMKEKLYTKHRNTVEPMMVENDRKATLQTAAVVKAVPCHERNMVLDGRPPPHDVKHLFVCPAHLTTLIPSDLWSRLTDAVRELSYLEVRDPY